MGLALGSNHKLFLMASVQGRAFLKQKFTILLVEKSEDKGRKESGCKPKLLHIKSTQIALASVVQLVKHHPMY